MKPGFCSPVGNRSTRGTCPGQLHVEGNLLAGPSQACGSENSSFRGQNGAQGRRQGGLEHKALSRHFG